MIKYYYQLAKHSLERSSYHGKGVLNVQFITAKRSVVVSLILLLLCQQSVFASPPAITPQQWSNLTKGPVYAAIKDGHEQRLKTLHGTSRSHPFDIINWLFETNIAYILMFGVLGYAIYRIVISDKTRLFRKKSQKAKSTGEVPGTTDESSNYEADWHRAEQSGNYRLAVRYSYIYVLQQLAAKELIAYRQSKTNYDYYTELAGHSALQPLFTTVTRMYEYAWYGTDTVSDSRYRDYSTQLATLRNQISRA